MSTQGGAKFSGSDLVGKSSLTLYYLPSAQTKVERLLTDMFETKNPMPKRYIKSAFTHLMHQNGLHWLGCSHFKEGDPWSR